MTNYCFFIISFPSSFLFDLILIDLLSIDNNNNNHSVAVVVVVVVVSVESIRMSS